MLAQAHEEANGFPLLLQPLLHCSSCMHQTATLVLQVLLLDELTTFLDSADQQGVLKAVKGLVGSQGSESVTALWVSMFLHLATDTCASSCNANLSALHVLHVWMHTRTCQNQLWLGPSASTASADISYSKKTNRNCICCLKLS